MRGWPSGGRRTGHKCDAANDSRTKIDRRTARASDLLPISSIGGGAASHERTDRRGANVEFDQAKDPVRRAVDGARVRLDWCLRRECGMGSASGTGCRRIHGAAAASARERCRCAQSRQYADQAASKAHERPDRAPAAREQRQAEIARQPQSRRSASRRCSRRRLRRIAERKPSDMTPNIDRPFGNERIETRGVVHKQCPRRFLETGQIARHRRHEVVGPLLRGAPFVSLRVFAARLVHQLAQRYRGTAGLRALEVAIAAYRSSEARRPVDISELRM